MKGWMWGWVSMAVCTLLSAQGWAADTAKENEGAKYFAFLKQLEGTWTVTMSLDGKELPGDGDTIATNELGAGGQWLISDFKGTGYQGHGMYGYDQGRKKFISAWAGSNLKTLGLSGGALNDSQTTLTLTPDCEKPSGKLTIEVKDKDTHVYTFIATDKDGKEHAYMTLTCRRKS